MSTISRQTSLPRNILLFCRYLRGKGYTVALQEQSLLLEALGVIDLSRKQEYRLAMKAVLCKTQKELEAFDSHFRQFWKELDRAVDSREKRIPEEKPVKPAAAEDTFRALQSWLNGNRQKEEEKTAAYSPMENLTRKDFSKIPEDELEELQIYLKAISRQLAAKANRRLEVTLRTKRPDLRRTLRKNMRRGGELMELVFRRPRKHRPEIVILCDTSRSMELYSAFLLQFMFAFQQVFQRVESFIFSTSLKRITPSLRRQEFSEVKKILAEEKLGWDGGTRIGESLAVFGREYAEKMLNKKTILVILSDGWDTGDPSGIAGTLAAIRSSCRKIIWLNPLAGQAGYRPETAAMAAALPYLDILAAAHNADSLRKLGKWL